MSTDGLVHRVCLAGRSTRNDAPPLGVSSTHARPPCSVVNCETSDRPMPVPGTCSIAGSAREEVEDRRRGPISATPGPLSSTLISTLPSSRLDAHRDLGAWRRVVDGIGDQVVHDPLHLRRIDLAVTHVRHRTAIACEPGENAVATCSTRRPTSVSWKLGGTKPRLRRSMSSRSESRRSSLRGLLREARDHRRPSLLVESVALLLERDRRSRGLT